MEDGGCEESGRVGGGGLGGREFGGVAGVVWGEIGVGRWCWGV